MEFLYDLEFVVQIIGKCGISVFFQFFCVSIYFYYFYNFFLNFFAKFRLLFGFIVPIEQFFDIKRF